MTAMAVERGHVGCTRMADGLLVQLVGALDAAQLPALRQVLLSPLPEGCRDVVVDAGDVLDVEPAALAVLVAANEWIEEQGARFLLSRSAPALEDALAEHGLPEGLPRLNPLPAAPRVPRPRCAAD